MIQFKTKATEMDDLTEEVRNLQERWNSMVRDITADYKITCDEAHTVHKWIATEHKSYSVLKKKINLDMRSVRNDYDLRLKTVQDHAVSKEMRLDLARTLHPYKKLLLAMDELLLKADEMNLRTERIIAQCEEHEEEHPQTEAP